MAARKYGNLRKQSITGQEFQAMAKDNTVSVIKLDVLAGPIERGGFGHGITEFRAAGYTFRPIPDYGAIGVKDRQSGREFAYPMAWCLLEVSDR